MSSDKNPEATQFTRPETTIREGVYTVAHRSTRMQLDLGRIDCETEGVCAMAWFYIRGGGFLQQSWLLSPAENNSFVLQNVGSEMVLDLEGNGEVGKHLICKSRVRGSSRQEWKIEPVEEDFYSIRNSQFPENVLEIHPWGEAAKRSIHIVSGEYIIGAHDQQWEMERRRLAVSEVRDLVGTCPILQELSIAWPSSDVLGMLVIRSNWRDQLMKESGLMCQVPRTGILDHRAFAIKLKETVQTSCAGVLKIDGYAILFGVVGGSADVGSKAYNWYLTDDLCEIVFLNPLNGRELTAKGLQNKGFRAEWAIC